MCRYTLLFQCLPETWTTLSSRTHWKHQSRNSRCNRGDFSPAGCRNPVYTGHSAPPSRSAEGEGSSVILVYTLTSSCRGRVEAELKDHCSPYRCRDCMGWCWCCPTGYTHIEHTEENLCIRTHSDHTVDQQSLLYTHTDPQTCLQTHTPVRLQQI